jgi:superfamily II DNA or RNA helicase
MMKGRLMGNIVEEWKKHAGGRRTVVFAVNVEHSQKLAEAFRDEGIAAAHLDGKTSVEERTLILLRLEKYELQVVCNCDVLSEGWDQPSVKCAVFARPTASLRLHMQQSGRVLRPWDVTSDIFCDAPSGAVIIDHAGNVERHGLPHQDRHFDLQMGEVRKEDAPTLHTCKKCYLMWTGSSRICPECGAEREVEERKPIRHDEHVVLKELDPKKVFTQQDAERQFFIRELTKAKENGKKPGFAAYRFKDKFNKWPPFAWTAQAKQLFAADVEWQRACGQRQQVRQHWESQMQQKTEQIQSPSVPADTNGFTEEPSESWWNDDEIPF